MLDTRYRSLDAGQAHYENKLRGTRNKVFGIVIVRSFPLSSHREHLTPMRCMRVINGRSLLLQRFINEPGFSHRMSVCPGISPQTRSYAPAAYIRSRSASELLLDAKDRASSPHDGLLQDTPEQTPMNYPGLKKPAFAHVTGQVS